MRIGSVVRGLRRLADKAEDRKIDLEADFPGASPGQRAAIDEAQACAAQAMELLSWAHGVLAGAFPDETTNPKGKPR